MAESNKKGSGNVVWMLSTFLLVGILVGLGVSSLSGGLGQTSVPGAGNGTTPPPTFDGGDYETPTVDDDAVLGDENALVTLIEFSDYQCPYCNRFETETFPYIKENFIDTGLVKLVYRDFPLSFHENAHAAAEATECAEEFDLFWEFHDILSTNYDEWTVTSTEEINALFAQYASDLGADYDTVLACLDNGTYYDEVEADMADGRAAGVNGTPSFFINGEFVVGALPYEDYADQSGNMNPGFESLLNAALEEVS